MRQTPPPDPSVNRRAFVAGTAAAIVAVPVLTGAARATTTTSASGPALDRAAGAAVLGGTITVLASAAGHWVLARPDGSTTAVRGLEGAAVHALAQDRGGLLAAGSDGRAGTLWRSYDGLDWTPVLRLSGGTSEFSAIASGRGAAIALGSVLREGVPLRTVVARRTGETWTTTSVTGLATDEQALTALSGERGDWVAAAVGTSTTLYGSPDGVAWSALAPVADVAVRGLLVDDAVRWTANTVAGAGAVAGVVGGASGPVAVDQEATAVGVVRLGGARVSVWLSGGAIATAGI